MKFLVNWELLPLPPEMLETALKLIPMELEYMKRLKEQGKVLSMYAFPGERSGITICDVESHEELQETMLNDPYFMFLDYSSHPLTDLESTIKAFGELLEKVLKK